MEHLQTFRQLWIQSLVHRMRLSWRIAGPVLFSLLYVAILTWFAVIDVYHRRFFNAGHGTTYLTYNLFRVLFIAYLACIFYSLGHWQLRCLERRYGTLRLNLVDEFVLCFFSGAAVAAFFLFALGFLNLYYRLVMALITIPLVAAAYPAVVDYATRVPVVFRRTWLNDRNTSRVYLKWISLGCVGFLMILLLIMKGLPPGGYGDYYTHYFPYFRHVVQSHGLWPNDIWYHFYVSKGATITFLGVLLTDLQAPELVTYLFFLVSALTLYSIVSKFTSSVAGPLTAMAAYIAAFVYTDLPGSISAWGTFQKHHEFTASLIAAVAWALIHLREDGGQRKAWTVIAAVLAAHAVLFAPTSLPLVLLMIGLAIAGAGLYRRWPLARSLFTTSCAGVAVVAGLMALNYTITGMVEITPFRPCWKFADQERFSRSWSPYLMVLLDEGSAPDLGDVQAVKQLDMASLAYIKQVLRAGAVRCFLPHWLCVVAVLGAIALQCLRGRRIPFSLFRVVFLAVGTLAGAALLSQITSQPVSVFRYFSFTVFFGVAASVSVWLLLFRLIPSRRMVWLSSYILPYTVVFWVTAHVMWTIPEGELQRCWDFARGSLSLASGFASTKGVFPPAVAIREVTGPAARVYTLNLNNYCMAPECELESFVSFALRRDWHEILFEPAPRARAVLEAQGLNYFLIDLDADVIDIFQHSPLLCPANIQNNLEVAWRQGNVYLLTWPSKDTTPLSEEFLLSYTDEYLTRTLDLQDLYERVRLIYEQNKGQTFAIRRDTSLAHVKGWQ
jgi:hypothetical protein